jgi:hypothetical protein
MTDDLIDELNAEAKLLPADMARATGLAAGFTSTEVEATITGRTNVWAGIATHAGFDVYERATSEGLTLSEWKQHAAGLESRPETLPVHKIAETGRFQAALNGDDADLAYEASMVRWAAIADHADRREEAFTIGLTMREWMDAHHSYQQANR